MQSGAELEPMLQADNFTRTSDHKFERWISHHHPSWRDKTRTAITKERQKWSKGK